MPEKEIREFDLDLRLERRLNNRTSDEKLQKQIDEIARRAFAGGRGRKWEWSVQLDGTEYMGENGSGKDGRYLFRARLTAKKTDGKVADLNLQQIIRFAEKAGSAGSGFKNSPWRIVAGHERIRDKAEMASGERLVKEYTDVGTHMAKHFDHIFGRDPQIQIIYSSILAAVRSDFNHRFHCVLHGPPGCGKSEILQSFGHMLGDREVHYLVFDATSTTQAGVQKILLDEDNPYIPPVLIIEEIEKAEENSLRWLLGILDQRAIIQKVNARVGYQARNVKMLCLATVNDLHRFNHAMSGALASRFSHEIYCPRPSRAILKKILEREVQKINGNPEWIEPALDYAQERNLNDPRKVVPICLCGGDDLLTGKYQKALDATRPARVNPKQRGSE